MGRSPESRLVPVGREQASSLGVRLSLEGVVEKIVCSSLPRTLETAELIGAELGLEVEPVAAFWELSKGNWEGVMPRHDLPPDVKSALETDPFGFRYPEGESYADVCARAVPEFKKYLAANVGGKLLFVLHGDVLRVLLFHMIGFPENKIGDFVIHPCSLTELFLENGRFHLVRFNDANHLP